jgi:hypothetical protein
MGSIPMMIRRMVEILLTFLERWNQLGNGIGISINSDDPSLGRLPHEVGLSMDGKRNTENAFFQGKAGFRNIAKVNWKTTSGSPSFFLPCQALLNPPFSLSRILPFLN